VREKAETELAELQASIAPLEEEINQLGRQFWVDKKEVVANKYELSSHLYRQIEQEEQFFEKPAVTLQRLTKLEQQVQQHAADLANTLSHHDFHTH
jgi:type I restriction enzyme M protein